MKVEKYSPKKVILIFFEISPAIFFAGGKFFSTLKPNSQRSLGPMPTFPFPGGVMGSIFLENHQQAPTQLREVVHQYTKDSAYRFRS
jgi:hypothetical protein